MRYFTLFNRLLPVIGCLFMVLHISPSYAVPSFARQTGLQCSNCHTAFPQLSAFGREFKMQGYILTGGELSKVNNSGFSPQATAPLSMMIQATWNSLKKAPDEETDSTQIGFPAQLSLFYSGRITDKMGAFVQINAEQGGSFSQDNTDIRYANEIEANGKTLLYGVSLNNSPTVQDPWNSTPTWSFPWFEAGYGYEFPDTLISSVGGSVAGLTAYGFWDNHVYGELGSYQAANTDAELSANALTNNAPYWRFAYASENGKLNWMVGTFGLSGTVRDDTDTSRKIDDVALDTQFQWMLENAQSLTVDASYIHEKQPNSEHVDNTMVNATWYMDSTWGVTLGYRGTSSSENAMALDEDSGVWLGAGDRSGTSYQAQLDYMPWLNTRFALQYTAYTKIDGESDGTSNANQVMLGGWVAL